jgi:hypothetical protein
MTAKGRQPATCKIVLWPLSIRIDPEYKQAIVQGSNCAEEKP